MVSAKFESWSCFKLAPSLFDRQPVLTCLTHLETCCRSVPSWRCKLAGYNTAQLQLQLSTLRCGLGAPKPSWLCLLVPSYGRAGCSTIMGDSANPAQQNGHNVQQYGLEGRHADEFLAKVLVMSLATACPSAKTSYMTAIETDCC